MKKLSVEKIIELSLLEDIGSGDITTVGISASEKEISAKIIAKQDGILAGIDIVCKIFKTVDSKITCSKNAQDGDFIRNEDEVLVLNGMSSSLLKGERVALNFLQRMSGIATLTRKFVDKISHTNAKILDTRKTTPLLRELEKYSVKIGGGYNHRMGLYDAVLIKENHIESAGSISKAVTQIINKNPDIFIEVEVKNLSELKKVLDLKVDRIMLDNMSITKILQAVEITNGRVELEISGGINLNTIRKFAETGVDYISIGMLTHSYKSLDFSMLFK
ncbi:MAG: carboxylating nicotinate-nucleotide diphosphorylase [Candidatus Cloacimonetes bacterium]|nr:carboxylating nicotinate-nucleotide diphosphorylase [Candidatus Cloacimonadota bacterium]MBL7107717.1 carboxylating nicotinate-nucleotide diphosphorylase [Candidatus Cloacimonadota bacterium]